MKGHEDPQVAAAHAALRETLDRMEQKMCEIEARHARLGEGAPVLAVRVDAAMERAIARYMWKHRLGNRAEAIRLLIGAGLAYDNAGAVA